MDGARKAGSSVGAIVECVAERHRPSCDELRERLPLDQLDEVAEVAELGDAMSDNPELAASIRSK